MIYLSYVTTNPSPVHIGVEGNAIILAILLILFVLIHYSIKAIRKRMNKKAKIFKTIPLGIKISYEPINQTEDHTIPLDDRSEKRA